MEQISWHTDKELKELTWASAIKGFIFGLAALVVLELGLAWFLGVTVIFD